MPLFRIKGKPECKERPAARPPVEPDVEFKLVCKRGEMILRSYVNGKRYNLATLTREGLKLRSHNEGCGMRVGYGGFVVTENTTTPPRSTSQRDRRLSR